VEDAFPGLGIQQMAGQGSAGVLDVDEALAQPVGIGAALETEEIGPGGVQAPGLDLATERLKGLSLRSERIESSVDGGRTVVPATEGLGRLPPVLVLPAAQQKLRVGPAVLERPAFHFLKDRLLFAL